MSASVLGAFDPVTTLHGVVTETLPNYLSSLPLPKSVNEVPDLSLDDWYTLLPLLVTLASPAIGLQFLKKLSEAYDLNRNSSGWFQWSSAFYSGDGIVSALPYFFGLVPGLVVTFGTLRGGSWTWLMAIVAYVLVPIFDLFIGEDSYNPTEEQEKKLKNNVWFRFVMWLYTPSYIATILLGCHVIATKEDITFSEIAGITTGVGIAGGFGIGCVHELIHRPALLDLTCGIVACVFANYSHFWIEHLWGHHKRVATDEDPASSNLGDDLYTFWVRCIYKSFTDAVDIENRFMARKKLPFYRNRILQGYVCSAIIGYAIQQQYGNTALAFYVAQGIIVALHIENANFIEHYGLRRRKVEGEVGADGEPVYERPGWFHAWDTADRLSNWILFKIQRHPDHHTNAGRPYQILRTFAQSPTMPTGYAGMFVLSWFPPLWRAVMDPLVENAYRKREEMEAKGIAASAFPKGSNNMSSYFKKVGEGYYEAGSTPYEGKDNDKDAVKAVWGGVDFDKQFEKKAKSGKIVESGKIAEFSKKDQ